jgi:hypothetical protein
MPRSLTQQIGQLAEALPEGKAFSARSLLHLGNRAAVDQALSRLARHGKLLRVERGLYTKPIATRFGLRAPSVPLVLENLSEKTGETIAPHGAAAANALGLTTQVPVREVYLTSGRSRRLMLGKQTIELRHAPGWQLTFPGRRAGEVIRALTWLRNRGGSVAQIVKSLPPGELQELLQARTRLPSWLAEEVSSAVAHD